MKSYKGCEIVESTITTDVTKSCFGKIYTKTSRLFGINGTLVKPACARPLLTSKKACKDFIDISYLYCE